MIRRILLNDESKARIPPDVRQRILDAIEELMKANALYKTRQSTSEEAKGEWDSEEK